MKKYIIPALMLVVTLYLLVAVIRTGIHKHGFLLFSESQNKVTQQGVAPDDQIALNRSKRIRPPRNAPPATTYSQKQDIVYAFTKHPFNAQGTNEFAIEHYSLSENQVKAIKLIANDTRRRIAGAIAERIVEVEAPGDAERVFEFKASAELASETEEKLYSDIKATAGTEFAEGAVNALVTDSRFLWGGKRNIRIAINPIKMNEPNSEGYRKKGITIVKMNVTNSQPSHRTAQIGVKIWAGVELKSLPLGRVL